MKGGNIKVRREGGGRKERRRIKRQEQEGKCMKGVLEGIGRKERG